MRPGAGFNATATAVAATAMVSTPSTSSGVHSEWHSPVPYLFGGLAAMLGLIAFALLILACSYWKLSGYLEGTNNGNRDDDVAEKPVVPPVIPHVCYEEKIVVIMAGDEKPTFLATPMSSRNSSFGDKSTSSDQKSEVAKTVETEEPSMDSQKESETTRDQESSQRENLEEL